MDLELKDRRGINSAVATFSRIWPYLTIAALLVLLAITNLNKPTAQPSHSKNIVRNTLLVRFAVDEACQPSPKIRTHDLRTPLLQCEIGQCLVCILADLLKVVVTQQRTQAVM